MGTTTSIEDRSPRFLPDDSSVGKKSEKSEKSDSSPVNSSSSLNVIPKIPMTRESPPPQDLEWLKGKLLPRSQGVAYFLPPTNKELDRYQMQHELLCLAFGKYVPDVAEVLKPGAKEMAIEFDKVQFLGIDCVNIFPVNVKPSNCEFKLGNVLNGLDVADNSFDFVHIRALILGIRAEAWPYLIKECFRVCKPGGWIQVLECDQMAYNCGNAKEWYKSVVSVLTARGLDPYAATKLHIFLSEAGFTSVYRKMHSIPVGWCGYIGKLMLDNITSAAKAAKMTLASTNPGPDNEYNDFIDYIGRECSNSNAYYNFYAAWGKKPISNTSSRPEANS
ncbi:hypothetical protein BC937DRAFT_89302 [Endogone sp. FLAS-F59071]|nr:hypothetical protein BC937DRAFT_89302 [Endogone sp. FLAS-F59071]|eukprot:RUS22415.1 hypothetical protein BC937DRAFT_89302 [Endogone sp. FLAS-F59071]